MSREKQIEEMANVINEMDEPNAHYYDETLEQHEAFADCFTIARYLYNAGYRKQSENTVELHCKVGDTVYHTDGIRIYELEIFDVSLRKGQPYYETESIDFDNDAIGKSVFLSKEGAENALAKMKGGAE